MDRSITFFLSVAASMVGYYSLTVRSASSKAKKNTLGVAAPRVFSFIMNGLPSHSWLCLLYSPDWILVKRGFIYQENSHDRL